MGFFAQLVVIVVEEKNGRQECHTQVIEFEDSRFVSWQSASLPSRLWVGKGKRSIYFERFGNQRIRTLVQPGLVTPMEVGMISTHTVYQLKTEYRVKGPSVCHVVLPEFYVPDFRVFRYDPLPHIKKAGNNIAVTWAFDGNFVVMFTYKRVSNQVFTGFGAVGEPIRMKFSPEFKAQTTKLVTELKNEGENVLAKTFSELVKQ